MKSREKLQERKKEKYPAMTETIAVDPILYVNNTNNEKYPTIYIIGIIVAKSPNVILFPPSKCHFC